MGLGSGVWGSGGGGGGGQLSRRVCFCLFSRVLFSATELLSNLQYNFRLLASQILPMSPHYYVHRPPFFDTLFRHVDAARRILTFPPHVNM